MTINEIIDKEIEALEKLNSVLEIEREALINDKSEELIKLIEDKKSLFKDISIIEKERISLYNGKVASDFVFDGIVKKDKVDKLQCLVDEIRRKQETNMALTKQSINYIRVILNTMGGSEANITYSNNGKVEDGSSTSIFTTKA